MEYLIDSTHFGPFHCNSSRVEFNWTNQIFYLLKTVSEISEISLVNTIFLNYVTKYCL